MVYYKDNEWHIANEKVIYTQNGEQLENFVGQEGKDWWDNVNGVTDIDFVPVDIYAEQLDRLAEVNQLGIGDGFSELITNYVMENQFPGNLTHKLREIQIEKEKGTVEHEINLRADVDYLSIMTGVEL